MDWAQVLAIVLLVMPAIIIGIFYNNRRIDDLHSDMDQRFSDMKGDIKEMRNLIVDFLTLVYQSEKTKF